MNEEMTGSITVSQPPMKHYLRTANRIIDIDELVSHMEKILNIKIGEYTEMKMTNSSIIEVRTEE